MITLFPFLNDQAIIHRSSEMYTGLGWFIHQARKYLPGVKMSIQFLTTPMIACIIEKFQVLEDLSQIEAIIAPSGDNGFDFDEDELAQGLCTPEAESALDHCNQVVEADEFDALYHWFIS